MFSAFVIDRIVFANLILSARFKAFVVNDLLIGARRVSARLSETFVFND